MEDIVKTTSLVKEELVDELYLLEVLKDDLVNVSALARRMLPTIKAKNPKATVESITMAIKRFVFSQRKEKLSTAIAKIIAGCQLSTRNDVVHMTFERNQRVLETIADVSRKIRWGQEELFYINQGSGEVTVIIDEKNMHLLKGLDTYRIELSRHLSVLSINEAIAKDKPKSIDIPGIHAYFLSQLARRSINIIEVISTYSQINFVLENEDLMRAHDIIRKNILFFRKKQQ